MVVRRVKNLLLFWAVAIGLILSVACAKKNDSPVRTSGTPAQPANPAVPPPDDITGGRGKVPIKDSKTATPDPKSPKPPATSSGGDDSTNDKLTDINMGDVSDPSGLSPKEIFNGKNPVSMAGMEDSGFRNEKGEVLYYTDAGFDNLAPIYRDKVNGRSTGVEKALDKQISEALGLVAMKAAGKNGKVELSVKMESHKTPYYLQGELKEGRALLAASNGPNMSADIRCMDADKTCTVARVVLTETSAPNERQAAVIVRNTQASLYVEGRGEHSANPNVRRLMSVLLNTVKNPGGPQSVRKLRLITSHVVNGPAKFRVDMEMNLATQNCSDAVQKISWAGFLVKPKNSDLVGQKLDFHAEFKGCSVGANLSDLIARSRLIRNDGKGNLELELVATASDNAPEEAIRITIGRIHKPVDYSGL